VCVDADADMYEMLMIQNAQMHQMIMQQLMLYNLPRPPPAAVAAVTPENDDPLIDVRDYVY